jgi:hypothetical protein
MLSNATPHRIYLLVVISSFIVGVLAHWITKAHPVLCTVVAVVYFVLCTVARQKESETQDA